MRLTRRWHYEESECKNGHTWDRRVDPGVLWGPVEGCYPPEYMDGDDDCPECGKCPLDGKPIEEETDGQAAI